MPSLDLDKLVETVLREVLQHLGEDAVPSGAGHRSSGFTSGELLPLVAANWKMNFPRHEREAQNGLSTALDDYLASLADAPLSRAQTVLVPPATLLCPLREAVKKSALHVGLGAQNVHPSPSGAHTGELSVGLLKAAGASWTLVGHSERRAAGESPDEVGEKMEAALGGGLGVILCVGETLQERRSGSTFRVLRLQLSAALSHARTWSLEPSKLAVAYEPVWAIGTGEKASVDQIAEAAGFCRKMLAEAFDYNVAKRVRVLYGGSVKPQNTAEVMSADDVDGVLVGGASLEGGSFGEIVGEVVRTSGSAVG